jgi:histidine ammonia-lyase
MGEQSMTITLNGSDLTVTQVVAAARHGEAVALLNEGFAPPVRRLGSVGQGDLGPVADLAHGLLTRSGFEVAENEGLALVSSNAFTTAWACIAIADADGPRPAGPSRGRGGGKVSRLPGRQDQN